MAFTAAQLVTRAYHLTGIVSRDLQTVSKPQLDSGMFCLNALLGFQTANTGMIPYFTKFNFTSLAGQETYFIQNLVQVETLTFTIPTNAGPDQTVRFPMGRKTREDYWGTPRANGIESLPYIYETERVLNGMNVSIYFEPNQNYEFELFGKFVLSQVVPNQDLAFIFEPYYIEYLRYSLSIYLCEEWNVIPPPTTTTRAKEYENLVRNMSPTDFTQKISTPFNGNYSPNYAYANASGGYVPTGGGY